jgi:hypothetical protein
MAFTFFLLFSFTFFPSARRATDKAKREREKISCACFGSFYVAKVNLIKTGGEGENENVKRKAGRARAKIFRIILCFWLWGRKK